jgi:hypothetical protein
MAVHRSAILNQARPSDIVLGQRSSKTLHARLNRLYSVPGLISLTGGKRRAVRLTRKPISVDTVAHHGVVGSQGILTAWQEPPERRQRYPDYLKVNAGRTSLSPTVPATNFIIVDYKRAETRSQSQAASLPLALNVTEKSAIQISSNGSNGDNSQWFEASVGSNQRRTQPSGW